MYCSASACGSCSLAYPLFFPVCRLITTCVLLYFTFTLRINTKVETMNSNYNTVLCITCTAVGHVTRVVACVGFLFLTCWSRLAV